MRASRLSSSAINFIVAVVFVLMIGACSSFHPRAEFPQGPGFNAEARVLWSPNAAVLAIAQDKVAPDRLANQVFQYYCASGRQMHTLSVNGRIFTGREKSGVALDQAERNRTSQRQNAEEYLKRLFVFHEDLPPRFSSWESHPDIHLATKLQSEKDIINYGRNESVPCSVNVKGQTSQFRKYSCQTFIVGFEGSNSVLLYAGDLPLTVVNWKPGEPPARIQDSKYYASSDQRTFPFEFGFLQVTNSKDSPRPVRNLEFLEPKILSDRFVVTDGHDLSTAIKTRHQTWNDYVAEHTALKLANTDAADVEAFEASLDLEPFCRTAKSIQDLQSK